MKWIHIRDNIYKCPKCGIKFSINMQKPWKCCPVCEQKLNGISANSSDLLAHREEHVT